MKPLCKYCLMPVGRLAVACPRCRGRWPGVRPRWVRDVLVSALLLMAAVGLVAVLWTPVFAR